MKKQTLLVILSALFIGGCSSIELHPHAHRVIASTQPAPKGCKYMGQVIGNQGNFFTGEWTSNKNLEQGAMHDIKNKAANLGANYIHLINSRAGVTGSVYGDGSYTSGGSSQTNVTNIGNAYYCKETDIGL